MKLPILSKKSGDGSKQATELRPKQGDTLFALMRRIEQRVSSLETQVTNLRRDFNRWDRQLYAAKEKQQLVPPRFAREATEEVLVIPEVNW